MTTLDTPLAVALRDRYLLERELGRGGMATVYLARDVRHHRSVALKVLHPELAAVLGSERFLKEIELTAHLQHPHILPLFDSGQVDGRVFYVMPYVEGESLRDRLMREKQLPVADAVRLAREIAGALDYAHRQGIVHRDIKPENILLHDGQALIADFGIALAASNAGGASRLTETGLSLGTPHYMSPEQAMGERDLTGRSDVYALGAVVYEMLTGAPPFVGPTPQSVVAKVLTEEPRGVVAQRRSVPDHVEAAVLTSLEKLPADRFASAAEFAAALAGDTTVAIRRSRAGPAGPRPAPGADRRRALMLGGAALWLGTAALAAWAWTHRAVAATPPVRRSILAETHGGDPRDTDIGVSADGSAVVSLEGGRVVVRRLDRIEPIVVPGSDGGDSPFLTADGRRVGFRKGHDLTVEGLDGADPLTIPFATAVQPSDAGTGRIVAVDSGALVLIDLVSARREVLLRAPAEVRLMTPHVPAGGHHVLVAAIPGGSIVGACILAVELGSHLVDTLVDGGALRPQVAGDRLYFVRTDGAVQAVGYARDRGRTVGPIVPTGDLTFIQRTGLASLAAGRGVIVYGETAVNRVIALGPGGRREVLTSEPGDYHNPRVSPDGQRLLLDRQLRGRSARDIWVLDLADRSLTRVTSKGDAHDAVWTADGRSVTYVSLGTPGGPLFTARADGSGEERPISLPHLVVHPGQWLADGSGYVVGLSTSEEGPSDIVVLPAAGGAPEPLVRTSYTEYAPAISPDQQWLAYSSNESGRAQVYLRPLRGRGRILVSEGSGVEPVWSRDGRRLYYIEEGATTRLMAARIGPGSPARVLAREVVVDQFRHEGIGNHANWDVTPDDRLVYVEPVSGGRLVMVTDWEPRP